jgi:hypothetical protein
LTGDVFAAQLDVNDKLLFLTFSNTGLTSEVFDEINLNMVALEWVLVFDNFGIVSFHHHHNPAEYKKRFEKKWPP